MTFSNQRVREIERQNQLLLEKIMKNGPSGDGLYKRDNLGFKVSFISKPRLKVFNFVSENFPESAAGNQISFGSESQEKATQNRVREFNSEAKVGENRNAPTAVKLISSEVA